MDEAGLDKGKIVGLPLKLPAFICQAYLLIMREKEKKNFHLTEIFKAQLSQFLLKTKIFSFLSFQI